MIKINLATKKQSHLGADTQSSKVGLKKAGSSLGALSQLPLKRILLPLIVGYGASFVLDLYKEDELKKMDAQIKKVSTEQTKLKFELDKTKDYDNVKKQLEADEQVITSKIETIQKLITDRQTPSRILVSLAKSIPNDVWLSSFKIENPEARFRGTSFGFNQISDFMKSLNESAFFQDLRLEFTQQVKDEAGLDVAVFELAARRR